MHRLYLRIYLAVLASLAAFALVSGVLWRQLGDAGPAGTRSRWPGALAQNVLPPADRAAAPSSRRRWTGSPPICGADVALFARRPHAGWPPSATRCPRRTRAASAAAGFAAGAARPRGAIHLPDGRWLVARVRHDRRRPGLGLFFMLALDRARGRRRRLSGGASADRAPRAAAGRRRVARRRRPLGARERRGKGRGRAARQRASTAPPGGSRSWSAPTSRCSPTRRTSCERRSTRIRMAVELLKENADPRRKRELEQDIAELDTLIDEILTREPAGRGRRRGERGSRSARARERGVRALRGGPARRASR